MNISNLKIGFVFNDFPSLCEALGVEPEYGGRNREFQKIDFKRYFDWDNERRKYIITKIYSKPKEKIENRGKSEGSRNNNDTYMKFIDPILTSIFAKLDNKTVFFTVNQLAERAGIISSNYIEAINNKTEFYKVLNKEGGVNNKTAMYDVFSGTDSILKAMISSSLNRLKDKNVISYNKSYIFIIKSSNGTKVRLATGKESNFIRDCENSILKEMDIQRWQLSRNDKLRREYYGRLKIKVFTEIKNIEYYFFGYKINRTNPIEGLDVRSDKIELNNIVKKRLEEKIVNNKKEVEKKCDEFGFGMPLLSKEESDKIGENYMHIVEVFINYLLDISANKLNISSQKARKITTELLTESVEATEGYNDIKETNVSDDNDLYSYEDEERIEDITEWAFDIDYQYDMATGKLKEEYIQKPQKAIPKYLWQNEEFTGYEDGEDEDEDLPF